MVDLLSTGAQQLEDSRLSTGMGVLTDTNTSTGGGKSDTASCVSPLANPTYTPAPASRTARTHTSSNSSNHRNATGNVFHIQNNQNDQKIERKSGQQPKYKRAVSSSALSAPSSAPAKSNFVNKRKPTKMRSLADLQAQAKVGVAPVYVTQIFVSLQMLAILAHIFLRPHFPQ